MEPLPSELLKLEQQLRSCQPQTPQATPEQLLYQAGWEAALAQHAPTSSASSVVRPTKSRQPAATSYWAAACAALVLLSGTLAWQVWQQPQPGIAPVIAAPDLTPPSIAPTPEPQPTVEPRFAASSVAPSASYLELRQRVTRGGLTMWSVSTPLRTESNDESRSPPRDWQSELLREAL